MDLDRFTEFDAADYLKDDETIREYLNHAAADNDPAVLASALADVQKARVKAKSVANSEGDQHV